MRAPPQPALAGAVLWLCVAAAPAALAGFDAQQLTPAFGAAGPQSTYGVATPGHLGWEVGTLVHHDDDPLVTTDEGGARNGRVIDGQTTQHLIGVMGVGQRAQIGVDVPMILGQSGEALVGAEVDGSQAGAGLGDVRVGATVGIYGLDGAAADGLSAGLSFELRVPTGDPQAFQGDGALGWEARGLVSYGGIGPATVMANVGYRSRAQAAVHDVIVDDAVSLRLAAVLAGPGAMRIVPELAAQVPVGASEGSPASLELLTGAQRAVGDRLRVGLGLGAGLAAGLGTPDWRGWAQLSYAGRLEWEADADGDGIARRDDACADEAEDLDGFEDEDGCPDLDNDGDGLLDHEDGDPLAAEDLDGFEDEDGIPDLDNDGDGVPDAFDAAPDLAEDVDGFQDEDGAPEWDNDRDGLTDDLDQCPEAPEIYNGVADGDGCPDEGGLLRVTCDAIEVLDKVYFASGEAAFLPRSRKLLEQTAAALNAAPFVGRIFIDGHGDDEEAERGGAHALTEARAEAVRAYLIDHQVDPSRLEIRGMGAQWPVSQAETRSGQSMNRRVEFVVIDSQACALIYDPPGIDGEAAAEVH